MTAQTVSSDVTLDQVTPYVSPERPKPAPLGSPDYVSPELPEFDLKKPTETAIATPYVPPTYDAPDSYVPQKEATVAGQMDDLTAKDSSFMQQARRAGERSAQAKGLYSSSIAGTAGQKAAYAAAMPIATADARTFADAGMAGYQGELAASLKGMDAESQHNLTTLQGKIQSDLAYQNTVQQDYLQARNTTLQGMISSGLAAQEAEAALNSLEYQGLINAGLNEQQAQQKLQQIKASSDAALVLDAKQQEGANYRMQLESAMNLDRLAAGDRESVSTAMTNYGLQFQKDILNIQMDTKTNAEQKTAKIQTAQQVYESNMNNTAALYEIDLTWSTPFEAVEAVEAPVTDKVSASPINLNSPYSPFIR